MNTKRIKLVLVGFLVCAVVAALILQTAKGTSQTFELIPEAHQLIKGVELQAGDQLQGSFSFINLGPYRNVMNGQSLYYWVSLDLNNPNGKSVFHYGNYPINESSFSGSFTYTANESGIYDFWAFCGGHFLFENPKNPEIILSFSIIKNEAPTPSSSQAMLSPSPSVPEFSWLTILPILLTTTIALIMVRKRLQRMVLKEK